MFEALKEEMKKFLKEIAKKTNKKLEDISKSLKGKSNETYERKYSRLEN